MNQNKEILTRAESAQYLRISQRNFDALVANGEIAVLRIGQRVLISRDALARFIAAKTRPAEAALTTA